MGHLKEPHTHSLFTSFKSLLNTDWRTPAETLSKNKDKGKANVGRVIPEETTKGVKKSDLTEGSYQTLMRDVDARN